MLAKTNSIPLLPGTQTRARDLEEQRSWAPWLMVRPHQLASTRIGEQASRERGEGMDLDEIRLFMEGDSPRNIDWRVTARTQELHVRQYKHELEHPVLLWLDLSASMQFGSRCSFKSVLAAQIAALLGWVYRLQGRRVGGQVSTDLAVEAGDDIALRRFFALCESEGAGLDMENYQASLERFLVLAGKRARCYLISDFYWLSEASESCLQVLSALGRKHSVCAITVRDALELQLPNTRLPVTTDRQAGWIHGAHIRELASEQCAETRERLQQLRITTNEYLTGQPLESLGWEM